MALPLAAHAVTIQSFTFGKNDLNATWKGFGPVEVARTDRSIILHAEGTGAVITDQSLLQFPQAGILTSSSSEDVTAYFMWVFENDATKIDYSGIKSFVLIFGLIFVNFGVLLVVARRRG